MLAYSLIGKETTGPQRHYRVLQILSYAYESMGREKRVNQC
jgi:hypothetical protein